MKKDIKENLELLGYKTEHIEQYVDGKKTGDYICLSRLRKSGIPLERIEIEPLKTSIKIRQEFELNNMQEVSLDVRVIRLIAKILESEKK